MTTVLFAAPLLSDASWPVSDFEPDVAALKAAPTRIVIAVGEETGALDEMLRRIADFYDLEVEATTESLTAALEPIMIAVLGGIVGAMVISLYMPMFKIFDLVE